MAEKVIATIRLIDRLMQNGVCVGYVAMDNTERIARISLADTIKYVNLGKIANVCCKEVEGKTVLYGVNGFRIGDLPEIELVGKPNIEINAMYIRSNDIIGYLVTDKLTGKQAKINTQSAVKLLNEHKIIGMKAVEELKEFKKNVIKLDTVDDTNEAIRNYETDKKEMNGILDRYIIALEMLDGKDNATVGKIVAKISLLGNMIAEGKIKGDDITNKVMTLKTTLLNLTTTKESEAKSSMLNKLVRGLEETLKNVSKLTLKNRKAVESGVLEIKTNIAELKGIADIKDFNARYKYIKKLIKEINDRALQLYKAQEDNLGKIKLRENYINNEMNALEDTELKDIKRKIVETPWYIRYKPLMSSNNNMQACVLRDGDETKLRLVDMDIAEKFEGKKRVGFTLKYKGKTYEYSEKLTNMSLVASFMKVAIDSGLETGNINIRFKREDSTTLSLTV